jgi:3-oxoadipate enol-lactonase
MGMPYLESNGVRIHYRFDGPDDAPVLVLSNSLGSNLSMWDPQVPTLARGFRLLRYDTRGHGLSSVPPGPYNVDQLGGDVLALLEGLGLGQVSFCGLSLGGVTGMWLGVNAGARFSRLILCDTGAKIGNAEGWNGRIDQVRAGGMGAVVDATLERWFTPSFRASAPAQMDAIRQMVLQNPPEGYIANCGALRDFDLREAIRAIAVPTLVIAGSKDPATTPDLGQFIAGQIAGAIYVELDAAHLSNIEAAERFNNAVLSFMGTAARA